MTETPCRATADLRRYMAEEDRRERAARVECSAGCGHTVHARDFADYGWIQCKREGCEDVLCDDCQYRLDRDGSYHGTLEGVHEDGYCSPWCVVKALRAANERLKRLTEAK